MALPQIREIYTDGACSGNPGPGGWGVVVYLEDGSVHELGGGEPQTTNNRMEMQGAIAALEFLAASGQTDTVQLYTDSEYVKNGITKWVAGWKKKGWKTSQGKPVLNQDLWEQLDALNSKQVSWNYVRGHSGNVGNERCDVIARAFCLGKSPGLQQLPVGTLAGNATEGRSPTVTTASKDVEKFDISKENGNISEALQSNHKTPDAAPLDAAMVDPTSSLPLDGDLPREVKVSQLRHMLETLHMADEVASQGYLITSAELADLMDVHASAVTSRGDNWVWRNWMVSRVRREGNQILWQLERVD